MITIMIKHTHANHILPTAANLLGFTFLVLTSIRGLKLGATKTLIVLTGVCVIAFAFSALLSFQSLRTKDHQTLINYETWAERIFIIGLITCTIVSIFVVLDIA
jgi:hypothetical protein